MVEEAAALLHVDDVEGVGHVGLHVADAEVEPLLAAARVHVRVQNQIVLAAPDLERYTMAAFLFHQIAVGAAISSVLRLGRRAPTFKARRRFPLSKRDSNFKLGS